MKKRISLVLLGVLAPVFSYAANWKEVEKNKIAATYVDTSSIVWKTDSIVEFWSLNDYSPTQTYIKIVSSKHKNQINCKTNVESTLSSVVYSQQMGKGDIVASTEEPGDNRPVEPGTVGEKILKFVCKK